MPPLCGWKRSLFYRDDTRPEYVRLVRKCGVKGVQLYSLAIPVICSLLIIEH